MDGTKDNRGIVEVYSQLLYCILNFSLSLLLLTVCSTISIFQVQNLLMAWGQSVSVLSSEEFRPEFKSEIKQEFEMLENMCNIAQQQQDEEEMAIHNSQMKKNLKKRSIVSPNHCYSATKRPKFTTPSCTHSVQPSSSALSSSSSQLASFRNQPQTITYH